MNASFATYASQFLNRQNPASSSLSNSQPLFYSFTTEGSRTGNLSDIHDDIELDDEDDPHLGRESDYVARRSLIEDDEDDPYLRLDEEENPHEHGRPDPDRRPLVGVQEGRTERQGGWATHQAMSFKASPAPPSEISSDLDTPPTDDVFLDRTHGKRPLPQRPHLTESLLPRDGVVRPVDAFNLPDPRPFSRNRLVRRESRWTVAWLASVTACVVGSFIILFTTTVPKSVPKGAAMPYTTLLHTVPLLTILTLISSVVSYLHILLLAVFVKPVLIATSAFIPATLFISAIWAFVGSFMWEAGTSPTWSETVGLRLFSLIPLVLAIMTSRRLLRLPEELHTTSSILNLSTSVLSSNPFLLALSPLLLLVVLIGSIPFLTLSFRLLLIGYSSNPPNGSWEWHVQNWAGWSIAGTVSVWLWCWGIARGVVRTTCATVVGAWYFSPPEMPDPPPLDTYRMHAAVVRSTDTSLGSIILSSLLLTGVRLLTLLGYGMRRAPLPILPWFAVPLRFVGNMTGALSTLALVYVGLTGDEFLSSARRARALTASVATATGKVRYRRDGLDPSLAILTITPLTLTLPFALSAYLFVAHTLGAPGYAPVAALLAGGVTALVGRFCVGLVEDTADTLYMCYCIDRDSGEMRREEVFRAFEWEDPRGQPAPARQQTIQQTAYQAPLSPSLTESDGEIEVRPYDARTTQRPTESTTQVTEVTKRLDESHDSGGSSTMLGLDFV